MQWYPAQPAAQGIAPHLRKQAGPASYDGKHRPDMQPRAKAWPHCQPTQPTYRPRSTPACHMQHKSTRYQACTHSQGVPRSQDLLATESYCPSIHSYRITTSYEHKEHTNNTIMYSRHLDCRMSKHSVSGLILSQSVDTELPQLGGKSSVGVAARTGLLHPAPHKSHSDP